MKIRLMYILEAYFCQPPPFVAKIKCINITLKQSLSCINNASNLLIKIVFVSIIYILAHARTHIIETRINFVNGRKLNIYSVAFTVGFENIQQFAYLLEGLGF